MDVQQSKYNDEIFKIQNIYFQALDFDLEIEVLYSAFIAMKSDPSLSPSEAMQIGSDEWLK